MISKSKIEQLVEDYGVTQVVQEIIRLFLDENNLAWQENNTLKTYYSNYSLKPKVHAELKNSRKLSIKDLANYLELLIPSQDKKLNGTFFTPTFVAEFIINQISPSENDKNLDPSCGSGVFLINLVDYYVKRFSKPIRQILNENIFGVDLFDYNIERAKLLLSIYALLNNQQVSEKDFNLIQGDSLNLDWRTCFSNNPTGKFDNILGNPPYIKFQDLPEGTRNSFRNKYQTIKGGNFNLYFAFFEICFDLLKDNAKLGFITPNNYFTSLSGESLREFFQQKKCVTEIVDFNHKKVFDAQTYTAITFLKKADNNVILYDRIESEEELQEFLNNLSWSINSVRKLSQKKWRLLKSDEQENIEKIENIGLPLSELIDIRVGIATLKDQVYFVDSKFEKDKVFLKAVDGKVFEIEKEITRSIYKISDLKNQFDVLQNTRRIIFPYLVKKNVARLMPETHLQSQYPKCHEYLLAMKDELQKRDKGNLQLEEWFGYGRTQGLTKVGVKLVTPTFSQFPRFLLIEEGDAFFCNGYGLFLKEKKGFGFDLFDNPFADESNLVVLQKILNSDVMHYYVSKTSVSIEGGYPCYQKNFIERFSIPHFATDEIEIIRKLDEKDANDFLIEKYELDIKTSDRIVFDKFPIGLGQTV
jgi:methylase of polypeptide subunit release factors